MYEILCPRKFFTLSCAGMAAFSDSCEFAARLELLRTGIYKPLTSDGNNLHCQQMIAYNFVHGTHFHNTRIDHGTHGDAFATLFGDLTPTGRRLLMTAFNAVAHMNHVKGDPLRKERAVVVRTFFERLNAHDTSGSVAGWRVVHMLCGLSNTGESTHLSPHVPLVEARSEETALRSTAALADILRGGAAAPRAEPIVASLTAPTRVDGIDEHRSRESGSGSASSSSSISDDSSDDSQAAELSSDVDDRLEENVMRADLRRARKKKTTPAKPVSAIERREIHLRRFEGGFEASVNEGHKFGVSAANTRTNAAAEKMRETLIRDFPERENAASERILQRTRALASQKHIEYEATLTEMLRPRNVVDQFRDIVVPYLVEDTSAQRTLSSISDNPHAFLDERTCTNPTAHTTLEHSVLSTGAITEVLTYAQLGGRINPEQALGPVTAMAYHVDGVDARQRNLASYFAIPQDTVDRILARMDTIGNEETQDDGGDGSDVSRDLMLIENDTDVEAEEARKRMCAIRTRQSRLAHAFTRHSRRIELMETALAAAGTQFTGFPYPECVYELAPALCRPEVVAVLPLPHTVGAPAPFGLISETPDEAAAEALAVDRARVGLANIRFHEHTLNLMTAASIIKANAHGIPVDLKGAHSRAAMRKAADQLGLALVRTVENLARDLVLQRELRASDYVCRAALAMVDAHTELRLRAQLRYDIYLSYTIDYHLRDLCAQTADTLDFEDALSAAFAHDADAVSTPVRAHDDPRTTTAPATEATTHEGETSRLVSALMSKMHEAVEARTSEAAERAERQRSAGTRTQDDLYAVGSTALASVPQDIIDRDVALQMNIANTRRYMALNREFTATNNTNKEEYQKRFWKLMCDHAAKAHEAFFSSTLVDSRIMEMRKWFAGLTPEQRIVHFPCLTNMTPFASCMLWVHNTLVSPVVNLSQNPTAMLICYFAALHAARWYEDPNDPHLNVIMAGDGMSGKSFILNAVAYLSTPGVCSVADHMSTHAMHVHKNMDGFCYIIHEMQHRYLFPAVSGKDGSSGESGDALTFFKARLTKGRSSIIVLKRDKETGERDVEMFESSNQSVTLAATNDALANADENLLSRFIVLSVPRPRDQAEGCSAADRENTDDSEGIKVTDEHYKESTRRAHQLVRFRCAYAEFMIKAGVLPNGFMTGGARFVIDAVLSEMETRHSISTRDPRRRKMTEEMARTIALFYSQWIALGSPLAHKYASRPGAPPGTRDLWSWQAFVDLAVPFMYTSKEATIAALTLLDTLWAPNHYARILHAMAFDVAMMQNLEASSFLQIYRHRPASNSDAPESGTPWRSLHGTPDERRTAASHGGMAAKHDIELDVNYIVIEGSTDAAIYRQIADSCGRHGIRAADVEHFVVGQCKQYITAHKLVCAGDVETDTPAPTRSGVVPTAAAVRPKMPELPLSVDSAFRREYDEQTRAAADELPLLSRVALPSDDSLSAALRNAIDAVHGETTPLSDGASEASRDPLAIVYADLDAHGYPSPRNDPAQPSSKNRVHGGGDLSPAFNNGTAPPQPRGVPYRTTPRTPSKGSLRVVRDPAHTSIRIPVMVRGYKNPSRPQEGRLLRIATAFLEQRLGFDVTNPQSMFSVIAANETKVSPPRRDVCIEVPRTLRELSDQVRAAYVNPPLSFEWGREASVDFSERMEVARRMSDASADTSSPMIQSIVAVLGNAYLNRASVRDPKTQDLLDAVAEEQDEIFRKNPDPSKNATRKYPWEIFITCYPGGDYFLKSHDPAKHPTGRHLSFCDMLKVLPLHCNKNNTRCLQRLNHARLTDTACTLIDPMPLGESGDDYFNTEQLVIASERTRILRNAVGIAYTADVDYYEARDRVISVCHPGLPIFTGTPLAAWAPFTYSMMRQLTLGMIANGQIEPRRRRTIAESLAEPHRPVLYPEDDPRLLVEYPAYEILKRIRQTENIDRCEKAQSHAHLTLGDDIYMHDNQMGYLTFYSKEERERTKSEHAQDDAASKAGPSSTQQRGTKRRAAAMMVDAAAISAPFLHLQKKYRRLENMQMAGQKAADPREVVPRSRARPIGTEAASFTAVSPVTLFSAETLSSNRDDRTRAMSTDATTRSLDDDIAAFGALF